MVDELVNDEFVESDEIDSSEQLIAQFIKLNEALTCINRKDIKY